MLFELPPFEHIDATTTAEAVRLLGQGGRRAVVAGATDLLGLMKDRVQGPALPIPEVLVNVKPIEPMGRISIDGEKIEEMLKRFQEFRERYILAYAEAHRRAKSEEQFAPYEKVRQSRRATCSSREAIGEGGTTTWPPS